VNRPVRIFFVHFTEGVDSQIGNSAVANVRSSVPDVALSVIHNTIWCGRIPLIFRCSLRFISKFSRCSRIGRCEILHAGSGNPSVFHSATSPTFILSADFSGIFFLLRTSKVTYPWSRRSGCASSPSDDGMGLGEPSCSHFSSFILRMASFCKLTILLWQMSDHLFLTSLCRSPIIPFGAVGFRSSSAARSASSQNFPAALGAVLAQSFILFQAAPPCSTPPPH